MSEAPGIHEMELDGYQFTLNEEAKKYAQEVLNETDESRRNALKEIKAWLKENPKIKAKTDVKYLLPFLRGCKFNLEKTKRKITNFYAMRRDRPEWFSNRDPLLPEVKELALLGCFIPLRSIQDNQLVVIIRCAAHDPKKHPFNDVLKTGKMILDVASLDHELAQIYGVTAIFDMTGMSLGHARQLTPGVIQKVVHAWQNYHCRPKKLEFINAPLYINVVLNVFKRFMSAKLKGRVRVHFSGNNSLHQIVSKDILPKEYEGTAGELQDLTSYWYNKLVVHREWFRDDERFKSEPDG